MVKSKFQVKKILRIESTLLFNKKIKINREF